MAISNDPSLGRPAPRGMEPTSTTAVVQLILLFLIEVGIAYWFAMIGQRGPMIATSMLAGSTVLAVGKLGIQHGEAVMTGSWTGLWVIFTIAQWENILNWAHESWWPWGLALAVIASIPLGLASRRVLRRAVPAKRPLMGGDVP